MISSLWFNSCMAKWLKIVVVVVLVVFGGFVGWMNVTPGHFRRDGCKCVAKYLRDSEFRTCSLEFACGYSLANILLFNLAKVDFNR